MIMGKNAENENNRICSILNSHASGSNIHKEKPKDDKVILSETDFHTDKDCETTKAFLLSGAMWCYILPTAPPGCIIKNETEKGWEIYENEEDTNTFFV